MKPARIFTTLVLVFFIGLISCNKPEEDSSKVERSSQRAIPAFFATSAVSQTAGNVSISEIAEKSINSVVNIYSTKKVRIERNPLFDDPFFRQFFGQGNAQPQERIQQGLGSGVIVSKDGIILTNNHVVSGADELKITLLDKREYEVEVVGTDPRTDLAVLRLKGKIDNLIPMLMGDSDELRLAEVVLAIGNPFGLSHTVTMGIISSKSRETQGIVDYGSFIQTDAAINPGNSGGALINLSGELVGINTAIISSQGGFGGQASYQGVGFAIPINLAKNIMNQLVSKGKVVRGFLGVNIQDIDKNLAESFGLSGQDGVLVSDVIPDSPADKAGVQRQDIILAVDGKKVSNSNELRNTIAMEGSDKTVTIKVLRKGSERDVKVRLTELAEEKTAQSQKKSGESEESIGGGMSVTALTDQIRNTYDIPKNIRGVIVTNAGDYQGTLAPGDIIRKINNKVIDSPETFAREFKNSKKMVLLYVYRGGGSFYVSIPK